LPTNQRFIYFAKDFYGLILGAKLLKGTPYISGPHVFYPSDPISNAYFVYLFNTKLGYVQNEASFVSGSTQSLKVQTGTLNFVKDIFVRDYSTEAEGKIPSLIGYDGVTCIDAKEKIYMKDGYGAIAIQT
jgi:hypothetical protein